jgi:hypothetical protein
MISGGTEYAQTGRTATMERKKLEAADSYTATPNSALLNAKWR